jgi:hypothetical protein
LETLESDSGREVRVESSSHEEVKEATRVMEQMASVLWAGNRELVRETERGRELSGGVELKSCLLIFENGCPSYREMGKL